jgi:chromosome segregation ATPase
LLGLTLVENKLERNFRSIVEALMVAQTDDAQLREDLQALAKASTRQFTALNDRLSELDRKILDLQNDRRSDDCQSRESQRQLISSPKLNINLVHSPPNTQTFIPSAEEPKEVQIVREVQIVKELSRDTQPNKELLDNYNELKDKIKSLMENQVDAAELDRKLSNIKDTINLLKAEMKAMADREAKSSKRLSSFINANEIEKAQGGTPASPATSSPEGGLSKGTNGNGDCSVSPSAISAMQGELEQEMNRLHIEVNSLKLCLEELKESGIENRRKDNRINILVEELAKSHKRLDERFTSTCDSLSGEIKDLKMELLNVQTRPQGDLEYSSLKKSRKFIEGKESSKENISPNANQQINDRISKLQAAIQGLVTEAEFRRLKEEVQDRLAAIDSDNESIRKELKEEVQMLTEILDNKEVQLCTIQKEVEEMREKLNNLDSQCDRKNNIAISRHEELKKALQNLKEDLEFYKSMNQNGAMEPKTDIQAIGGADEEEKKAKPSDKSVEDLKRYVNRKLHDQRTYLLGLIRDLEKKSGGKSNLDQDLAGLWDKLAEVNLFLHKKANEEDVRKNLGYLEKKLAAIYQKITSSEEANEDARLAKTNWFCLSCDKTLHNYQGKVGQHIVWDSMPVKAGYNKHHGKEDKKGLPILKR